MLDIIFIVRIYPEVYLCVWNGGLESLVSKFISQTKNFNNNDLSFNRTWTEKLYQVLVRSNKKTWAQKYMWKRMFKIYKIYLN